MTRAVLASIPFALLFSPAVLHGSAAAATKSPCALVTAADATKALGAPVGPKKEQPLGLYQSCSYSAKGARTVTVQSRQLSHADFVKSAKANPGPVKHVAGIGGDAYTALGGDFLLVWKKGTEITFLVVGVPSPVAAEKQLAKKALGRL